MINILSYFKIESLISFKHSFAYCMMENISALFIDIYRRRETNLIVSVCCTMASEGFLIKSSGSYKNSFTYPADYTIS